MNAIEKKVLEETISFYNSENRSIGEFGCSYLTNCGSKCAVGRLLTEEALQTFSEAEQRLDGFSISLFKEALKTDLNIDSFLKEEYKGCSINFLIDLQGLHDNSYYWDKDGISNLGKTRIENFFK